MRENQWFMREMMLKWAKCVPCNWKEVGRFIWNLLMDWRWEVRERGIKDAESVSSC